MADEKKEVEKEHHEKLHSNKVLYGRAFSRYYIAGIIIVIAIAIAIFFLMQGKQKDVAAIVNGNVITMSKLDKIYDSVPLQYKGAISKKTILDQLIERTILVQEAEKNGIKISVDEAKKEIEEVKRAQGISEEKFQELLNQTGITEDDVISQYIEQLTIQRYINQTIFSKINVSDDEINEYYRDNIGQFNISERVTVRHILIGDANLSAEEKEQKAKMLLKNITKDNFCEYVEKYSSDTASISNCGEYTFSKNDHFVEEFKNFAFKNAKGKIGIANTQYGSHIIYIVSKEKARIIPLEEVREQIADVIKSIKAQEEYKTLYKNLKDKSKIEIVYLSENITTDSAVQISP